MAFAWVCADFGRDMFNANGRFVVFLFNLLLTGCVFGVGNVTFGSDVVVDAVGFGRAVFARVIDVAVLGCACELFCCVTVSSELVGVSCIWIPEVT